MSARKLMSNTRESGPWMLNKLSLKRLTDIGCSTASQARRDVR
ncbi:MAG: hypothetical protein ABSH41_13805 [Syntrophobacteraceae bacterium]